MRQCRFSVRFWLVGLLLGPLNLFAATQEFTLDNGLRLLVREDHRAPVVMSMVWYQVGASYETDGKTGISHVLEHMLFKGTEKYPEGEFSRIMAENGAKENAFTTPDYTAYYQNLASDRLAISFEMEADRMRNLVFKPEEFVKERDVVLEERRLRTDDKPSSLAYEVFKATAYQTSPYRNPTIGWYKDIEGLQLDDVKAWYRDWYAPNNAIVVVVGDVKAAEVLALAKQHFGSLPPSPSVQPLARPEVAQHGIKRVTIKRPAELPALFMGYKVPSLKTAQQDWEPYALTLLAYVLDGDSSARLTKHLVRGEEIATSLSASYDLYTRLSGLFEFSGYPAKGYSPAQLEAAIRAQIKTLQTELVSENELKRIKAQLIAGKTYERDSVSSQAMQLGALLALGLDWRLLDEYVAQLDAITPEQIRSVAQKYLQDEGLTVGVLEPQPLDKVMAAKENL